MSRISVLNFPPGQTIFKEGEVGTMMYLVKEGKVELLIKDQLLEVVGPSGFVGEMSLIDKGPRSASAITQTDCILLPVNQAQFHSMIQQTPSFAVMVMRVICKRLRRMNTLKLI